MNRYSRWLTLAVLTVGLAACANNEESTLKEGARDAGRAVGGAAREVGQGAKKVTKTIGHATRDGVKAVGEVVKEGTQGVKEGVQGKDD